MMPPQPTAYPGIPPGMPAPPGYGVVPGTDMRSLNSGVANMTVDENGGFVPATGQVRFACFEHSTWDLHFYEAYLHVPKPQLQAEHVFRHTDSTLWPVSRHFCRRIPLFISFRVDDALQHSHLTCWVDRFRSVTCRPA